MTDAGARQRLVQQLVAKWQVALDDYKAWEPGQPLKLSQDEAGMLSCCHDELVDAIAALSEGEALPSCRAMLEYLASDSCRGNRHEAYLGNCPVCVSRLQRLEGALAEGETSGALEIAPGVFRATTSSSIFTEGRAAPPPMEPKTTISGQWPIPTHDVQQQLSELGYRGEAHDFAFAVKAAPEPETGWQPIRALAKTWKTRARTMSANAKDTVVESLIAQRADAFRECADELAAALPPSPAPEPPTI